MYAQNYFLNFWFFLSFVLRTIVFWSAYATPYDEIVVIVLHFRFVYSNFLLFNEKANEKNTHTYRAIFVCTFVRIHVQYERPGLLH